MRKALAAFGLMLALGACNRESTDIAERNAAGNLTQNSAVQSTEGAAGAPTSEIAGVSNGSTPADADESSAGNQASPAMSNEVSEADTGRREHPRVARLRAHCARRRNDPGVLEPDPDELPENLQGHTWRCKNGSVLVCSLGASGRDCMADDVVDAERMAAFREFCREWPGAETIPGSLTTGLQSSWTCRGTRPVQTSAGSVDRDGYLRGAWRPL